MDARFYVGKGRRFYAVDKKTGLICFWLGYTDTEEQMAQRIRDYELVEAPKHVEARSFTGKEAARLYHKAERENERLLREELRATEGKHVPDYDPTWLRFK